ncbi:MAG: hypothetical protein ACFFKA_01580 [Candidatus Thorarchaeota archaeon]
MRISGSGTIEGGKIEQEIVVLGAAHIVDDLECNGIRVAGSLTGNSSLMIHGDAKVSGSFQIGGSLQGDNDMKVSGSSTIGQNVMLKGMLKISGSFHAGEKVTALTGIKSVGYARISGDLISERGIILEGSARVSGNIEAEEVLIGTTWLSFGKRIFGKKSETYKIRGNIRGRDRVEIFRTRVNGNIIGRNVKINKNSDVKGTIYYVENIEIHPKARVLTTPVQIKEEELDQIQNSNIGD